jgi:hypothetical protein
MPHIDEYNNAASKNQGNGPKKKPFCLIFTKMQINSAIQRGSQIAYKHVSREG